MISFTKLQGRLKKHSLTTCFHSLSDKTRTDGRLTVYLALELLNAPLKGRVFAPQPPADPYYDNLLSHNPPVWWSSGQRSIYSQLGSTCRGRPLLGQTCEVIEYRCDVKVISQRLRRFAACRSFLPRSVSKPCFGPTEAPLVYGQVLSTLSDRDRRLCSLVA